MKTYLKARYRLSDLLRAQRNDRMTSSLKRWIENGAPDKGDLEEDSYKILKQFYLKKKDLLYLNKDGIVACKRKEEDKVLYKYNSIVLPQLYQTELLFRSHDQMGHQGVDKVYNRIQKRFEWPGLKKACENWIAACLSCQQAKDPRKLRFPLQSIESSGFNEVVQIDHQKICMTATGYNQVLVMIDHFTKYAEAAPCMTASAEETCDHLINVWIARHGCPITFQSDNGKAFVGDLTKELMKRSQVAKAHSTTYHPQTNGLVERQNRTLVSMLRVYCSRYMDDWDKHLPQVMGAYNSTEHSTTGISPHMMLTGHEKALPLTFFYPEYEGKRTAYRAYLGSAPFKLRVDNRALSWLKTYSMDQSYIGRWIVRLDGYHMIIEHRTRDKHQNADSLSKKTEFYERLEEKQANQSEIKDGFSFLDKETYDKLPLTRWLDKSGHPIPGHPDLPVETAAEIKLLARGEPVPLDLLVRSNLVQQELTRLGINSIALLNKTVNVAPEVMGKLRDLLDREVNRHDREWMETMQRLTVTERTEKRPVSIRSRGVERDCRSIVNQLMTSMPKEVLLRTSFTEYGTSNQNQATEEVRIRSKASFTRRVHFTDAKEEYEPSPDCSSVDETMSGESDTFEQVKDDLSEESDTREPVQDNLSGERLTRPPRGRILSGESGSKRPMDRVWSGESRNISDNFGYDVGESVDSSVDSGPQSWDNTSETTSNSDVSEIAIHSLLVDWKQRGLDRETHQDPDRDRYTSDEEGTVIDNAADELELIAVSKRPTRLLPHGTVVRTNLEPSAQEATPLKKIWCVKLMDDAHAPEIMSGQMKW